MNSKKNGVGLIALIVTIIVMASLITTILIDMEDRNIIIRSEKTVDLMRVKELQTAANDIVSDYYLTDHNNITLKEYILERLRSEYNLSSEEEEQINIDENGNINY